MRFRSSFQRLTVLALPYVLGCGDDGDSETAECKRYKAALLAEAYADPEFTTPPVAGRYDAYRCPTPEEFVEEGVHDSLLSCADYLEGLKGSVPLGSEARSTCKLSVLQWADRDARVASTGVGRSCELGTMPSAGFTPGESYLETLNPGCAQGACLLHDAANGASGDAAYCSCRCDAADIDHPVCQCPSGFTCEPDLFLASIGEGIRGGYCVKD